MKTLATWVGTKWLFITILLLGGTASGDLAADDPAAVVARYNAAINERDLKGIEAQLVKGASQLNLRQAHAFTAGVENLVTDLGQQWRQVGPILFATTTSYTRSVGALKTHQDGNLAIVWAEMTTRTVPLESEGGGTSMSFTETYILFRLEGTWKIAALANNRPTR